MSLTQLDKIDTMTFDEETGEVILSISDEHNWESPKDHLLILQVKINAYLSFIEHKEYLKIKPEYDGKSFAIVIISEHPYPQEGLDFVARVQEAIKHFGIRIEQRELEWPRVFKKGEYFCNPHSWWLKLDDFSSQTSQDVSPLIFLFCHILKPWHGRT